MVAHDALHLPSCLCWEGSAEPAVCGAHLYHSLCACFAVCAGALADGMGAATFERTAFALPAVKDSSVTGSASVLAVKATTESMAAFQPFQPDVVMTPASVLGSGAQALPGSRQGQQMCNCA